MNRPKSKGSMGEPWLTPFDPQVLGGLRPDMNQYADGKSTILTPKRRPTQNVETYSYITQS
jgi:hypothetical protein